MQIHEIDETIIVHILMLRSDISFKKACYGDPVVELEGRQRGEHP